MAKQSDKGIPVDLPYKDFGKNMLFNRFAVETEGDFRVIYFGYCGRANVLIDQFACAVLQSDLDTQKATNLEYLGKLGSFEDGDEPPEWRPPSTPQNVQLVSQLGLCRFGNSAEIVLHVFAVKSVLDYSTSKSKTSEKITAMPVAILRSELNLHKHLIRILYSEP